MERTLNQLGEQHTVSHQHLAWCGRAALANRFEQTESVAKLQRVAEQRKVSLIKR